MRTLGEWLELQQRLHPRSIELGLDRVARVARALGVDRPRALTLTVGGTNGKGSTVAYLEAISCAAGRRTGAFTSPHLVRYNERIRIGGVPAQDAALVQAFEAIEAARGDTSLTFFEFNALAALWLFAEARVETQVLEVGLGGRLDAVNLLDADAAVLCSVGEDHMDWLGPTLEHIGREKAGIFRHGRPAILGSAMPASVHEEIVRIGAVARLIGRDYEVRPEASGWRYRSRERDWALPLPSLQGTIQSTNAANAIATLEAVSALPAQEIVAGALQSVSLPGRFQVVPGGIEWILDVAHNAPAARELAANLRSRPHEGRTLAVAGFLDDKDVASIAAQLHGEIDHWILVDLPPPRGLEASRVAARLGPAEEALQLSTSVEAGCALARALATQGDRIVVFGSFHVVGPALEFLRL